MTMRPLASALFAGAIAFAAHAAAAEDKVVVAVPAFLTGAGAPDRLAALCAEAGFRPDAALPALRW